MLELTLLGTEGCHLCELAQQVLIQCSVYRTDLSVYLEDIGESEVDIERYGVRIPVLRHDQSGAELDWPFDVSTCLEWLQAVAPVNP
ncbi:glutaredoxin family protein [Parathalassolituus penaei]|uniref:Glutaredoxin family protein n=1 Tax=Parathalassolituus penaei TaxID=2997323 RepID=A0A9X3IQ29_9GAMM|nr:glutaredoxin family protein [Parathalassolituus penaei]MCY0963727.1 glutaredoxin family protein [Parathalassolituus penaei]